MNKKDVIQIKSINATAIVLAGGNSRRMGTEKALLPVHETPLIEHVYNQLSGYFHRVLISAENADSYSFLGTEVIPDRVPGSGPLMGIASALEASKSDINFIVACDIPDINIPFVKMMIRESRDYDGVVPVNSRSQYEPLYAVYRKRMLKAMNKILSDGKKKISEVFKLCRIKYIPVNDADWLKNLNTIEDYEEYIRMKNNGAYHEGERKQKTGDSISEYRNH